MTRRRSPGGEPVGCTLHLTMAAGFEEVTRKALAEDVAGVRVVDQASGLLTVTAPAALASELGSLPYFSLVLIELGRTGTPRLDDAVGALAEQLPIQPLPTGIGPQHGFRIRVSDAGALVPVSPRSRDSLERAAARWAGLRPDGRGGGLELWVRRRRGEDDTILSLRIAAAPKEKVARGALKPDVAGALVRAVPPRPHEAFLDPFAGSGAIARARARYPARQISASDTDPARVRDLEQLRRRGDLGRDARVGPIDARDVGALRDFIGHDHQVDTVVTDPPWGQFEGGVTAVRELYQATVASLTQIVAGSGRVVLLTSAIQEAVGAFAHSRFEVVSSFPVLVNGKKASVVVACADP